MSDVVMQSVASNVFWVVIFLATIFTFKTEIKNLLNSLGTVKVAGASFELKDSRASLEYYVVLTNIIVEALSARESAKKLGELMSTTSIKQLARFALKYSKDVPNDAKEIELLKNIAMIIGRRGSSREALSFLDALLKDSPSDPDILNLKANLLAETDDREKQLEAERIRDELVVQTPRNPTARFNRALSKAYFEKDSEAIEELEKAIDYGFWKERPTMLTGREISKLRDRNVEFARLEMKLAEIIQGAGVKQ